jgi:hypothetical protein
MLGTGSTCSKEAEVPLLRLQKKDEDRDHWPCRAYHLHLTLGGNASRTRSEADLVTTQMSTLLARPFDVQRHPQRIDGLGVGLRPKTSKGRFS